MYDFIIDCPVLPSTTFIVPVAGAFEEALGASLAANASDLAAVKAVSNALSAVSALEYIKASGADAAIAAELDSLEAAIEASVASVAALGAQITNATVVAALLPVNSLCKEYYSSHFVP